MVTIEDTNKWTIVANANGSYHGLIPWAAAINGLFVATSSVTVNGLYVAAAHQ